MKKMLIAILVIGCATNLCADMKFDYLFSKFCTKPASANIDQEEYDRLVKQVNLIEIQCMNNGVYGKTVRDQIYSYLKLLGSPTALRLLEDLKKCDGE